MVKLQGVDELLRSRSFLIATDRAAAIYMPHIDEDVDKITEVTVLYAQQASLEHFKEKIEFLLKKHREAEKRFKKEAAKRNKL